MAGFFKLIFSLFSSFSSLAPLFYTKQNIEDHKNFTVSKVIPVSGIASLSTPLNGDAATSESSNDDDGGADPEFTDLQKLCIKIIVEKGGSAKLDVIQEYILKFFEFLRKRDGTKYAYEYKRVVLQCLANSSSHVKPIFVRVDGSPDLWKLGPRGEEWATEAPSFIFKPQLDDGANGVDTRSSVSGHKREREDSTSTENGRVSGRRSRAASQANGERKARQSGDSLSREEVSSMVADWTQLQLLIAKAILDNNKVPLPLEAIADVVGVHWGVLRKKDGSAYSGSCKKACQHCLSYNSGGIPSFRKVDDLYALNIPLEISQVLKFLRFD